MKFGGTSVKDAAAISRLVAIVRAARERGGADGPVVVVSALSKVTDTLLTMAAHAAAAETADVTRLLDELRRRHDETAGGAVHDPARRAALRSALDSDLRELATLAHALVVLRDASPRLQDALAAVGELLSSRIVAAALEDAGLATLWVDAREILVTDASIPAQPLMDETRARCRHVLVPIVASGGIPVLGGFIGATAAGVTTTLGRGGSDYSASIFGVCVGASRDPDLDRRRRHADRRPARLSRTRGPCRSSRSTKRPSSPTSARRCCIRARSSPPVAEKIPVRILNSSRARRCRHADHRRRPSGGELLTAIACKRDVTVIDIVSTRMLMAHGFLRRLFEVFERHQHRGGRGDDVGGQRVGDHRRSPRRSTPSSPTCRRSPRCPSPTTWRWSARSAERLRTDPALCRARGRRARRPAAPDGVAGRVAPEHHVRAAGGAPDRGDDAPARQRSVCRGGSTNRASR